MIWKALVKSFDSFLKFLDCPEVQLELVHLDLYTTFLEGKGPLNLWTKFGNSGQYDILVHVELN